MHERLVGFTSNTLSERGLREERNDSGSTVSSDNGDSSLVGGGTGNRGQETCGANDIEGGDTEHMAGVEDTGLLEGGSNDRDSRVDGVGDDKDVGVRRDASDSSSKVADNRGVGLEMEQKIWLRKRDVEKLSYAR